MLANSKVRWNGFEFDGELEAFAAAKKSFIKNSRKLLHDKSDC